MGAGVMKKADGGGRRRRGAKGRHGVMAEINVTPMVDVMLVLLIIFMVAAPMMTVGVPLELPKTAAKAVPTEQEEPLTISVSADGGLFIMSSEVAETDLIPKLVAIAAERTSKKVFIRADGSIPYERVAQIMGALNANGFREIGLVTDANGPTLGGAQGGSAAPPNEG